MPEGSWVIFWDGEEARVGGEKAGSQLPSSEVPSLQLPSAKLLALSCLSYLTPGEKHLLPKLQSWTEKEPTETGHSLLGPKSVPGARAKHSWLVLWVLRDPSCPERWTWGGERPSPRTGGPAPLSTRLAFAGPRGTLPTETCKAAGAKNPAARKRLLEGRAL